MVHPPPSRLVASSLQRSGSREALIISEYYAENMHCYLVSPWVALYRILAGLFMLARAKNLCFLSFPSNLIVLPHAAGSFLTRIFRGSDQNLSGMAGSARVQKCIQKFQLLSSVARPRPRFIGAPARPCARPSPRAALPRAPAVVTGSLVAVAVNWSNVRAARRAGNKGYSGRR